METERAMLRVTGVEGARLDEVESASEKNVLTFVVPSDACKTGCRG